ncbi:MAG: transketolase [Planctomycetaceae bacterium]|nr:transketolase [Planctomycetaceae bacterium]
MLKTPISIDQLAVNTIRTLSMDAVQAANSGHPGTPMALAPVAYALWTRVLKYDPADPLWPGRDRFILSCGHASMLLYSLLHLAGVKRADKSGKVQDQPAVSLDDIRNFRQWESRCPGHPEFGHTTGVETTTGPLGQGVGNSVGMAIAQRWLAAHFHRDGHQPFDYRIYALCSDGDLMEGLSSEAASLAGHLRLSNLCWIYDSNHITIEGNTDLAFSEDVGTRFVGFGWRVIHVDDANDLGALERAYRGFIETDDRPTLIIVRSHIAYGAPNAQDTHEAHGAPLGDAEIKLTKEAYGWPADAKFLVPPEVLEHFADTIGKRGAQQNAAWQREYQEFSQQHPELATEWRQMAARQLPEGWDAQLPSFPADPKGVASRVSSGKVLNAIAEQVPWLMGGAADLAPSTKTLLTGKGESSFQPGNYGGRNLHFGIREHAMASALNGMALSHLRPYGSTFLIFSDYLRPTNRLAALMELPVIYVYTHDSLGVGEDGPTHQPIEQLASLRAIPTLHVFRPADANEVVEAWRSIMRLQNHPAALVLTRQNLPTFDRTQFAPAAGAARGGYVLVDAPQGKPDVILLATGSEVALCVAAREQLNAAGIAARVVSLPCWELFEAQDQAYRDQVLPPNITARVAVELGVRQGWDRYLGPRGQFIGMDRFGASAPEGVLMKQYGFTVENVVAAAKRAAK